MEATRVLLLRDGEEADPYEQACREAGYAPVSVPVLRFTYTDQRQLRAALERANAYDGLIVTSPRAVAALVEVLGWLPAETARWHTRPSYAVGPATARALREAGFEPEGAASGSAEALADFITAREVERPLLFLCGRRRRETLPERLHAAGVPVEECCVYDTHLREDLDLTPHAGAGWVVFFSPSGVEAAIRAPGFTPADVRFAAIGETTAAALAEAVRPPEAVAAAPTPEALVAALRRYDAAG